MLAPGGVDFLYRMALYAPPVAGKENDPLRWNLAMQMLQTPNTTALVPQSWAPRMCARYATYSIDILNAFDHFGTLFDAMEGHENAFKTSMEGIEKDAYGPQVKIRDEFVAHMGKRVTLVTDYSTPISTNPMRTRMSSSVVTPPDATTGRSVREHTSRNRSRFGPCSMPSLSTSVTT